MKGRLLTIIFLVFALLPTAAYAVICCPTLEMPLRDEGSQVSLDQGSLCIFYLKTDNQLKPDWPPEVWGIEIQNKADGEKNQIAVQSMKAGSLLKKGFSDAFSFGKDSSSWEGWISFYIYPGSYRITAVRGGCNKGVGVAAVMSSFDFPFDIPFEIKEKECVYLGRVEMINRQRKSDDEIPSGDSTPTRLPQEQSGFGTGTFDVVVKDNFDDDLKEARGKYPALGKVQVEKRILEQWQRPAMSK